MLYSCKKPETSEIQQINEPQDSIINTTTIIIEEIYKTWILVEKTINWNKEILPEGDKYPVTLTFYENKEFWGSHDANNYNGVYGISRDSILFSCEGFTDVTDIDWYLDYLYSLFKIKEMKILSMDEHTMQLSLSNKNYSTTLHFVSKAWFFEHYFEFTPVYNF
jgi:hypothetical protein